MGFRRDGKATHERSHAWREWLEANAELLRAAGLPLTVLRSREDWLYLLRYGYHCDGPYPQIDFDLDELSSPQRQAFRKLLMTALPQDERRGAAWNFVCSPHN